jgi:pilus assembly protein Flp/PilA
MTTATSCYRAIKHDVVTLAASLHCWLQSRHEDGATAVEYALMVGLFAIAIMGAVSLFGTRLNTLFNTYSNTIPG